MVVRVELEIEDVGDEVIDGAAWGIAATTAAKAARAKTENCILMGDGLTK